MAARDSIGNSWADLWDSENTNDTIDQPSKQGKGGKSFFTKQKFGDGLSKSKEAASTGMEKTKTVAAKGMKKVKEGASVGFDWIKDKYQKTVKK